MNEHLKDIYLKELHTAHSIETQLVEALPTMAKMAASSELEDALAEHLDATQLHKKRVEQIFEWHEENTSTERTRSMEQMIAETEMMVQEISDSMVRDAAIIAGAQKVEHVEIALYGTLETWADELDDDDAEDLLEDTLDEEMDADETLTDIAEGGLFESGVNKAASE